MRVILREWEAIGVGTGREHQLRGMRLESQEARMLAEQLTQRGVLSIQERVDGLQIRARAHVGRVQLGSLAVVVQPKIASRELLSLLRYAYSLPDLARGPDTLFGEGGALPEDLVVAQLEAEARGLIERGIARRYERRTEQLASPRGRIDFAQLASGVLRSRSGLPCTHYPRGTDHLLNRTLLAGLELARVLTTDGHLRGSISRLCGALSAVVGHEELSESLLRSAARSLNRLVAPYGSILELVALLYRGQLLTLANDREYRVIPGFMFDMNRFFQRLLLRFLNEHLRSPWRLESEHSLTDLFRYVPGENPRAQTAPVPRPDYALWKRNELAALLDAKYRDLWANSLPRDMLYQLSIYALSQPDRATAAMLYPSLDPAATSARIAIRDPWRGADSAYVVLRPVPLQKLNSIITAEGGAAQEGEALALRLVGQENVARAAIA